MEELTNVYILELTDNCWYVGRTNDIDRRINEHVEGIGSEWTKIHKPINLVNVYSNVSPFEEDMHTKRLMKQYGIDKVRGGSYVKINLDEDQIYALTRELSLNNDQCYKCGKPGHFGNQCSVLNNNKNEYSCFSCGRPGHFSNACSQKIMTSNILLSANYSKTDTFNFYNCFNCGKAGHFANECKQRRIVCYRCEREGHYADDCRASTHSNGSKLIVCYRCGRDGHCKPDCYALWHVSGKKLL